MHIYNFLMPEILACFFTWLEKEFETKFKFKLGTKKNIKYGEIKQGEKDLGSF